jgi:hypothetical protein
MPLPSHLDLLALWSVPTGDPPRGKAFHTHQLHQHQPVDKAQVLWSAICCVRPRESGITNFFFFEKKIIIINQMLIITPSQ